MINSKSDFDADPYPGKPKILFIGLAESSHTHAWVNLLQNSEFNIRLFAMPTTLPPNDWKIRTYITTTNLIKSLDPNFRRCLYPTPEEREDYENWSATRLEQLKNNPFFWLFRLLRKFFFSFSKWIDYPFIYRESKIFRPKSHLISSSTGTSINSSTLAPRASGAEDWLSKIIQEWQPDIIHTLGVNDFQGGDFYFSVRKKYHLENIGKWVLQLRGGSDLTFRQYDPEIAPRIAEMMCDCNQILSDNLINIQYAERLGVPRGKFASIVPVPGTGGIDIESIKNTWNNPPASRRMILWPKSYECMWSKAIPVFEAIKIAWNDIQPCEIYILAANSETRSTYFALPEDIRLHCHLYDKIDRQEVLKLNSQARVAIMPSLVDGVPNCLFEAMAAGAFPIISPLDTIVSVVEDEKNVLFARNLYPEEIASALVRSMNDDALVENAALNNLHRVRLLADRNLIQKKVIEFYKTMTD
jgi:hypothetical protein